MTSPAELYLRDVFDIPEDVHAGDFKIELSGGFGEARQRVDEYVVTPQLKEAFRRSLNMVKAGVRDGKSEAAYLHGSFGSGKSHFMTVLHAVLDNDPAARSKPELQDVIAAHDEWLRGRRFMMVPFHLVGSADLDSAILGGYVAAARRLGLSTPPVYRSDAMLADARRQREFLADDAKFVAWLGAEGSAPQPDEDDLEDLDSLGPGGWSGAKLDQALSAPFGDPLRTALESALLDGPMSSYATGTRGASSAFLPLENGLAVMSRHTQQNGYDGLILFLDELILWLQAHMSNQEMVNNEVGKLVKLIESGDTDRPVPIVSFISRQRNLSQLVGADVIGADAKNLETQVEYLAGRFTVIELEDTNLPEIIKKRVLKPKPGQEAVLDEAFKGVESSNARVKDVLLDVHGATHADWSDFRDVYPLSPALLNVLVALSGALQRERTGLKLLSEMLRQRRDDMKIGQIIPLGDLWDVLSTGIGEAFTNELRQESEAATRLYAKVRAYLLEKYGSETDERFRADERIVKTLILSALAPDVSALARLTGDRLAALNLGSIRSRTVTPGKVVGARLRELIGAGFGEIRADGDVDPVFSLHLTDLDVEPLLDRVGEQDNMGARRIWVKDLLWKALGVKDSGAFVCERELVWRGSRRTAEFVFENVRDESALPEVQFRPGVEGRIRFVLDYPFDAPDKYPSDDLGRVDRMRRDGFTADTLVWLPDFLSGQRSTQLGRLLKIKYLLERDRLSDYASHLAEDQRIRVQHQLQAQLDTLTSELTSVLQQLYGISGGDEGNVSAEVPEGRHIFSFNLDYQRPRLHGGAGFEYNLKALADGLLKQIYPKHPDLDLAGRGRAVTTGELKTVLAWITKATEDGSLRTVVERDKLALLRQIVHPLELGEVHDGPLNVSREWQRRIDQQAAAHRNSGPDYGVEEIRSWIEELGWTGLDKPVANLIIATYALLSNRAWVLNGSPVAEPPELERIGTGWALRAQPMPTEDDFAAARDRAARIFGMAVPAGVSAGNVAKLAAQLRDAASAREAAVNGLRHALGRHATDLGVAEQTPRARSVRHASDLLARLSRADASPTELVTALAAAAYDVSDEVLGAAISSAAEVLGALDVADWSLLRSVRGFVGRTDVIGERAERLLSELAEAAKDDEFTRRLAPVLTSVRSQAVDLISEAGRLAAQTPPTPPERPAQPDTPRGSAEQVSLTQTGEPRVPSTPQPRSSSENSGITTAAQGERRAASSQVESTLALVREEMRRYAEEHPGAVFDIIWRAAEADREGDTR
ncbi:PglY protein [Actinoallomurus sp. CA-142502]|uniref:PglY protein n=1 Tax=Actinoallomurus sp. CA-142502 TaxID=3239885 RepID=UPI003D8A5E0D